MAKFDLSKLSKKEQADYKTYVKNYGAPLLQFADGSPRDPRGDMATNDINYPMEAFQDKAREKRNKKKDNAKDELKKFAKGGKTTMKAQKYNMGGMAAQAPMSDDKDMSMLRKKKKRPSMGMPTMKKGGKVRGCGMATQGNRKAKMVTMKGA